MRKSTEQLIYAIRYIQRLPSAQPAEGSLGKLGRTGKMRAQRRVFERGERVLNVEEHGVP